MDVHRARFISYPTPSITCLAFSRSNDIGVGTPRPDLRLAVGRSNGNIEIWNPLGGIWTQESIFIAGEEGVVDSLVWTQDPDDQSADGEVIVGQYRLFSIGGSSDVKEWNLETGMMQRKSTGNFAEVWCLAAQPRWRSISTSKDGEQQQARSQDLVAGCGDGTLVVLTTEDNDLQFKRFLARVGGKKARCLTVTYQKPNVVVAGFADGTIRVFDTRNGSVIRNMSLGVGIPGAPKTALVWKILTLPNNDIVSADSNGELRIWDGKTLSMTQRLRGHEGDCLDVITSSDGKTLFTGGVDGRIAMFKQAVGERGRSSWSKISHRRIHQTQGPIKSLATYDSKGMSVVVSGGDDPAPVIAPLREFGRENIRALPFLPQHAQVVSAPRARLIASWWDTTIYIYRIASQKSLEIPSDDLHSVRKLVAKISLDSKEKIRSVAISQHGNLIAAAFNSEVKIFQLKRRSGEHDTLAVRKLKVPSAFAESGSRLLSFSHDGRWLASVTSDSEVQVVRFDDDAERPKLLQVLDRVVELERQYRKLTGQSGFKKYERTITKLAFDSNDAVLIAGDLSGYLDSWVLQGEYDNEKSAIEIRKHVRDDSDGDESDDSGSDSSDDDDEDDVTFYGQGWVDNPVSHLPKLESAPLVLAFRPTSKQTITDGTPSVSSSDCRVLAITARHHIYEIDVIAGQLTEWSRQNPTAVLPNEFTRIRDRVIGATWDAKGRVWLYGSSFVFMLDVTKNLSAGNEGGVGKRKRQGKEQVNGGNAKKIKSSGAGGRIENGLGDARPETVSRSEGGKAVEVELATKDQEMDDDDEEDAEEEEDDEDDDIDLRLQRIGNNTDEEGNASGESGGKQVSREKRWWCSFKYRPILGMVALDRGDGTVEDDEDDEDALEVVIVERPAIVANGG